MPEIFIYLFKVNLALLLFYLVYYLLLRRLTFYILNRFYLLFAFGFSAIYPLVDISGWFVKEQGISEEVQYIIPDWQSFSAAQFSIWSYVQWLFWGVVAFFLIRLLVRLLSLWQIHKESVPARWQFFHYRHVMRRIDPFSFWKNIYIHADSYRDSELNEIFSHEQIHVEQLHTFDTLIAELFSIGCWFNPISWLMRHAVRENLEFITDRKVLRSGINKQSYQYSLLNLVTHQSQEGLVTHFNLKHLRNRIQMMNKKRSSYAHLGKYVFAMPLIIVLALIFSFSNTHHPEEGDGSTSVVILDQRLSIPVTDQAIVHDELGGDESGIVLKRESEKPAERQIRMVRVREQIKHGDTADREEKVVTKGRITSFKITASDKAPLVLIDGVEGDLSALNPDQIKSINVLKGKSNADLAERFGQKASEGVILIETKP